jgi:hypothetical protein
VRRPFYYNPSLMDLPRIAEATYRFTLRHAAMHPGVVLEDVTAEAMGGAVYRIRARVANRGQLPTHVSNRGRGLARLRPVRVELHLVEGVELLSAQGHQQLGHLSGVTGSHLLEWFVSAPEGAEELAEIVAWGGAGGNAYANVARPQ